MKNGSVNSPIRQPIIKPMTPSDLDSVIRIEEQSFQHPWARDQFMDELERGSVSRCHVALMVDSEDDTAQNATSTNGPVVGFIMTWLVVDELHITNIAVGFEARRGGVAAALLEHSIGEAIELGAQWCQLEVRISNRPARELYGLFGFKTLGTRKRYYPDGEDAVVMGKDLTIRV